MRVMNQIIFLIMFFFYLEYLEKRGEEEVKFGWNCLNFKGIKKILKMIEFILNC